MVFDEIHVVLILDDLGHVGLCDKPGAESVGKVEFVSGILRLKVVNQCLTILSLRSRSSSDPVDSILQGVTNTALWIACTKKTTENYTNSGN